MNSPRSLKRKNRMSSPDDEVRFQEMATKKISQRDGDIITEKPNESSVFYESSNGCNFYGNNGIRSGTPPPSSLEIHQTLVESSLSLRQMLSWATVRNLSPNNSQSFQNLDMIQTQPQSSNNIRWGWNRMQIIEEDVSPNIPPNPFAQGPPSLVRSS